MPDYGTFPLWYGDGEGGNVDPERLPLSTTLREKLRRWSDWYDATLDNEYPPDGGFRSVGEVVAFEQEGIRLWQSLVEELGPGYQVVYYSLVQSRVLESPPGDPGDDFAGVGHLLAASLK